MHKYVLANLRVRPVRTALSILAVSLQVFLLLFMMGMTDGMLTEYSKRIEGIGADLLVQQPNASMFLAFSRAVLPLEMKDELERIEGVKVVAPVLGAVNNDSITMIYGIDYESYNQLGGGFHFLKGRPFEGPNDIIIDDIKRASKNLDIGHAVELLNTNFRVVGIVEHGRGARYFIPLKTAQQLLDVDTVSMFWVESEEDPALVEERIAQAFPGYRVTRMDAYLSLMVSSNLPELKPFTNAIILVGVLITFLVVLLSMYTIVLERTREIGILKALGASRGDIVALVLREAVALAILGAAVGVAASYGVKEVLAYLRPTLPILFTPGWLLQGFLLAVIACILGSAYPAFRAAAADPVAALAYE